MVLRDIDSWLSAPPVTDAAVPVSPRCGAAALIVAAAHRRGRYSQLEQDRATAALMKLFHIGNPDAQKLRREAEGALKTQRLDFPACVKAAGTLDRDEKEALMTHLFRLVPSSETAPAETALIVAVRDAFGFSAAQVEALRPAA